MELADFAEVVGVIRDVLIILIFSTALVVLLVIYRKTSKVVDSVRRTMKNVEEMADAVSNSIVGPATAGSGLASGAGKLAAFVLGLSRKRRKGGRNDG